MRRYAAMKCEACEHENIDGARFCAKCGALLPTPPADDEDPLIGQIVGGRYRVTGVLGEGGMGKVYVGEQQMGSTVRKVAVKTLHKHLSQDPSVLARFHRECGTVAQLEHPNTIKFFDFGATADGTLYIAMEFVKGKSLMDAIESGGPLAPDRVLRIMKQVCGALDEAHRQGIVHRDLKPENIILTESAGEADFVKVLDFGIAARTESADAQKEQKLTQQGMVLGTPPYMSPEQFTGKALDLRSDLYSLGVMVYEMLTGKLPFDADTPWQWATQHMTAQPTPFEAAAPAASAAIPEQMRATILRALAKDREKRQASAREFFQELSGGGGLTVDLPALAAAGGPVSGRDATAAMAAVPNFSAAAGGYAPAAPQAVPHAAPAQAPPAAFAPPPPRPAQGGGGNKGLVIGLVGLLVVLGTAILIVVVRSGKKDDDQPLANPFGSSTGGGGVTEVKPVATAPTGDTATAAPSATDDAVKPNNTTKPVATTAPTTSAKPVTGASACAACLSAASGGNIQGAAASYSKCDDAGQKAACSAKVRGAAPQAAKSAALNGNCAQAKGIVAAANGMGAGSGPLSAATATCK